MGIKETLGNSVRENQRLRREIQMIRTHNGRLRRALMHIQTCEYCLANACGEREAAIKEALREPLYA